MRSMLIAFCLSALVGVPALVRAEEGQGQGIRRFALLVGANYGGLDRVRLRYAESDTRAMAKVLTRLGGVSVADRWLLTDPQPSDLEQAFVRIGRRLAQVPSGQRPEFVFYYSGHSDERGLLLGGQRFDYARIRKAIGALPAKVRVAILDSCSSGAFTRAKGGTKRQAFLVDDSTQVQGYAVLTSSSANETAQESDKLGGSFFTHFLVSGLRGAADLNQDRKITLAEAYQYSFNETLARTESTQMGPQHPNYDFRLAGAGDLTLTDLRETSAVLELPARLSGRLFIRSSNGHLVAEVNKPAQTPMVVGLEPGDYMLTLETEQGLRRGTIQIGEGGRTVLAEAGLEPLSREQTRSRGDHESEAEGYYKDRFASFSVLPGLDTNPGGKLPVRNHLSFNVLAGYGGALSGFELSGLGAIRKGPVVGSQLSGMFNMAERFTGFQVSGISNVYTSGPSWGATLSGIADVSSGEIHGAQLAGVVALARSVQGLQVSVFSGTWDDIHGAQIGVVSYAADVSGVQAGVVPVVSGEVRGLQWGVTSVIGGDLTGAQLGVLTATGGEVSGSGAQLGVINWGTSSQGLMIGLINMAAKGEDSIPIGLINIIADGLFQPALWINESSLLNVALKMGSRKAYSILGAGFWPQGEHDSMSVISGIGAHLDLNGPLWLEVDLVSHGLLQEFKGGDSMDLLNKLRACVGWRFNHWFAVYGGLSFNLLVSNEREHAGPAWARLWAAKRGSETYLDLGLGLLLGVQL